MLIIKGLKRRLDDQSEKLELFNSVRKCEEWNRDEEYNNWNEKYTRRNQQIKWLGNGSVSWKTQ